MKFWVQRRGDIEGPFDRDQLQRMVTEHRLRPDDKVSTDQKQWLIAARVPGLMTIQSTPEGTPLDDPVIDPAAENADAQALDNEWGHELALRPEEPPPAEPEPAKPPAPDLNVGAYKVIEVPEQPLGMALGGFFGVLLVLLSIPVAIIVDAYTGGQFNAQVVMIPSCALVVGLGLFLIAAMGTGSSVELEVTSPGVALVTRSKRFAYVNYSRRQTYVVAGDRLEKNIKAVSGIFTDASPADIALIMLFTSCCFLGGLPGVLMWLVWFVMRGSGENMCHFRLLLFTRESPAPLQLYREKVPDYFATRFGTPSLAEKIIKLIQSAVPEVEVKEVVV